MVRKTDCQLSVTNYAEDDQWFTVQTGLQVFLLRSVLVDILPRPVIKILSFNVTLAHRELRDDQPSLFKKQLDGRRKWDQHYFYICNEQA